MSPRHPTLLAALTALLILTARPSTSPAAPIATSIADGSPVYTLINSNAPGTNPVTQVQFDVIPTGSVVSPDPATSPLSVLPDSRGYDPKGFTVALAKGLGDDGREMERLVLLFGVAPEMDDDGKISGFQPILGADGQPLSGLEPGGSLHFALSVGQGFGQIEPPLPSTGLVLTGPTPYQSETSTPVDTGGSQDGGETVVPEPMALMLWSVGAVGLGLIRARSYRRSDPRPA